MDSCSASGVHSLPGVYLQLSTVNLAQRFFLRPAGAHAPSAPPGYVCVVRCSCNGPNFTLTLHCIYCNVAVLFCFLYVGNCGFVRGPMFARAAARRRGHAGAAQRVAYISALVCTDDSTQDTQVQSLWTWEWASAFVTRCLNSVEWLCDLSTCLLCLFVDFSDELIVMIQGATNCTFDCHSG